MKTKRSFSSFFFIAFAFQMQATDPSKLPHAENVLYVKFKDDSGSDVVKNVTLNISGNWKKVHQLPAETLQKFRTDAAAKFKRKIHDPRSEYHFFLNNPSELAEAKKQLEANPLIDYVLYVPILVNSDAPDYFSSQTYLHASNSGINAEAVWSTYNNRGAGIKLCDIEYSYNANHTDLPAITILGDTPDDPFGGSGGDHGTAVLGEIASLNNGIGTTGIASDCDMYFAGAYTNGTYDIAVAITSAMTTLTAGDVILLEQQTYGPNYTGDTEQGGLVAVEWYQPFYDAIVLAVGQGITVIEAAGNGEENLDAPVYSVDNGGHYPFLPGNGSGAIIVGAGAVAPAFAGSAVARSRLWYSNYGSCVHVQGNGEAVHTTGYGDLYSAEGVDQYFTADFGGTSGASPIVAGAAVLLQSVYKNATGTFLSPEEVKTYLINSGQAQQNGSGSPVSKHIGPLPDIFIAIGDALASTGIPENAVENTLAVYPNPGNGNFTFVFAGKHPEELKIVNALGETISILKTEAADNTLAVDLSAQPKGVYFAQCRTGSSFIVKKIVIQ